jgi:polyisoprenoid-binding protein YceI
LSGRYQLAAAGSRISFDADATLGGFQGTARKVTGWVETAEPNFSAARGAIEVDAASFETGIGMRDRHLRETLETNVHPLIRFVLDSARYERTDSTGNWYRLHGALTIRSATRRPDIVARVSPHGDTIVVQGQLATRFTEFALKPPSKLLGTAKVKDAFTIRFDCTFVARPE